MGTDKYKPTAKQTITAFVILLLAGFYGVHETTPENTGNNTTDFEEFCQLHINNSFCQEYTNSSDFQQNMTETDTECVKQALNNSNASKLLTC